MSRSSIVGQLSLGPEIHVLCLIEIVYWKKNILAIETSSQHAQCVSNAACCICTFILSVYSVCHSIVLVISKDYIKCF